MKLVKSLRRDQPAMLAVAGAIAFLLLPLFFDVSPFGCLAFGRSANLLLTLRIDRYAIRMNDSIDFTLTLTNLGPKEAELHYNTAHQIDLFLYAMDGKMITFLTKGYGFAQVLANIRLRSGESKAWHGSWDRFDETGVTAPGPYLIRGSVLYFGTTKLPIMIMP